MKKYHDLIYTRDMTFNDVVKYFEECLYKNSTKLNFRYLERKIIDTLNKDPSLLFKRISAILGISQKKTSQIIKELRKKGVFLGSTIDYKSVNSVEFFSFNVSDSSKQNSFFIDEYSLFPDFKIFHGITFAKNKDDTFYYVLEKKTHCNSHILNFGISIQDWKKHEKTTKNKDSVRERHEEKLTTLITKNKLHILHLMKNCERNYRRPDIHSISEKYNISVRTLFRTKSKLTDSGIIKPSLIIECDELMRIFIISKQELNELYNKVPFIRSFKVQDNNHDVKWINFLSIFVTDFKFLYSLLMNKTEIFQVMYRKQLKLMKEIKSTPISFKHKIYTN
jgi:DNA-binding Lrp family transcriptional regulator